MNNMECQICCCEFDECSHRPRILYCGHTFCSICLKALLIDGEITCPNCQKIHAADNVETININFLIESMLSPDDQNKAVELDKGYKCEEHCYELNFFCETHDQWICRDCTVIEHKPCSHSLDCKNENDCRVISKKERLDKLKAEKIKKVKRFDEIYGLSLKHHCNEYESELCKKLALREDLKERLRNFTEENDSEMKVLSEKINSSINIESTIIEKQCLVEKAQDKMIKALKRDSVEECCKIVDKTIGSAYDWAVKEENNIVKEKNAIAEVEISLKEMEKLKQKLCESESILSDSKDEIEDLKFQIDEHKLTTIRITSKWEESEKQILDLEYKIKKSSDQSVKDWDEKLSNQMKVDSSNKRIIKLENELGIWKKTYQGVHTNSEKKLKENEEKILELENKIMKNRNAQIIQDETEKNSNRLKIDGFKSRISELESKLKNSKKKGKVNKKSGKGNDKMSIVETQDVCELKNQLLNHQGDDCFLAVEFSMDSDDERGCEIVYRYSELQLYPLPHQSEPIVLLEAFHHNSPPPGSMMYECRPMIADLEISDVEFVYLDIGKLDFGDNGCSLVGKPFGRLIIKLDTSPRRRAQMVQICASVTDLRWKYCNFNTIRNKGRPGELVTCKYYRKFNIGDSGNSELCDNYYDDLEYDGEEHLISGGKVCGYIDDSAGFSIITRHKYDRDTRWPLLGHVVSGLEILKEAVIDHDANTIGIHSHGIGFLP